MTSPVWLWNAGHLDRARAWTAAFGQRAAINARLTVNDVLIEGRRRTPKPQLARALKIRHGGSILAVDLDAARARIEALPWVAEAAVERRLPGTIYVEITERKPIARWRIGRRIKLIDADGVAISGFRAADYARLPLVSGPGAPAAAGPLLDFLKTAPKLAARVREARRLGKRRWDLIFRGGVVLMLPERAPDKAWRKFARLEAEHRLLARGLLAIDLRLPDRVVLRAPGPLPPPLRRTGRERAT